MFPDVSPLAAALTWWERLDRDVLHLVNCRLDLPALEWLLMRVQSKTVAVPLFVGVVLLSGFFRPRRGLRALLTAAVAFGVSMGLATLMWDGFERPRPAHVAERLLSTPQEAAQCAAAPEAVVVRKHVSRRPAFPSRHALTAGAFAVALWGIAAWLGWIGASFAVLVALGRVYAGIHWPSDVVAGLSIGALVACGVWRLLPALLGLVGRRRWVEAPRPSVSAGDGASREPGAGTPPG